MSEKLIYKYEIVPAQMAYANDIIVGKGVDINPISAEFIGDALYIWAEVDPEPYSALSYDPFQGIFVMAVSTGGRVPPAGFEFIDTAINTVDTMGGRPLVFHVYYARLRS